MAQSQVFMGWYAAFYRLVLGCAGGALIFVLALWWGAVGASPRVDANTANAAMLQTISGIGPARAQRIIAERQRGAFKSLDDLQARVPGIGGKTAMKIAAAGLTVVSTELGPVEEASKGRIQTMGPIQASGVHSPTARQPDWRDEVPDVGRRAPPAQARRFLEPTQRP
jgi:competence protein ComEA